MQDKAACARGPARRDDNDSNHKTRSSHPNRDVLNGGAPTPEARLGSAPAAAGEAYAAAQSGAAESYARRYRSYDPASGTFRGYDGRRYTCE
jgi:hypothetical protein